MKKIIAILALICILFSSCSSGDAKTNEIKERGVLRVGVKVDVPRFGYLNTETNLPEGLEIDIAKIIAKNILGDEELISFLPVTALTRDNMLENNEIDIIIATFTITEERKKTHNFSTPYFTDQIGFLVKKESGITTIQDFSGKNIGVTLSSTANETIEASMADMGQSVSIKGFASYPEVKGGLVSEDIDIFAADKSILFGYVDDDMLLLEEGINPQDYGIATKLENKEFANSIDSQLKKMIDDGTLQMIIDQWLG